MHFFPATVVTWLSRGPLASIEIMLQAWHSGHRVRHQKIVDSNPLQSIRFSVLDVRICTHMYAYVCAYQ
jgi:hypothetical protein